MKDLLQPSIAGVIGIPTRGIVSIHFLRTRTQLQSCLAMSWTDYIVTDDLMARRGWTAPFTVADKQNEIVRFALENNADWVFFLEDDVICPPNSFLQLYSRHKDIVSGVYWSKSTPPVPLIFRGYMKGPYYDWHVGDFFKADGAGMGLVLIKTKVFKQIPPPWFSENYVYHNLESANSRNSGTTSDLYFFRKAKDYGFELFIDTTVQALHWDRFSNQLFGLQPDMAQANPGFQIKPKGKKLIADIGAGTFTPNGLFQEGKVIRIDIREEVKPDILCDIRQIPVPDKHFDIIYVADVLEHFSHRGVQNVLMEWLRILKVGGQLRLIIPNIEWAAKNISDGKIDEYTIWVLYGAQFYPKDFHAIGFTPATLKQLLENTNCLKNIKIDALPEGHHMKATAKKFKHVSFESISPEYNFKRGDTMKQ